jgi:uncharacterized membrane protein
MNFLPDPLHPALVHFPIVLALVALVLEALARHPRGRTLEPAAALLVALAALGAIVAVVTGNLAHDEAVVPPAARALIERHGDLGAIAMWALVALAIARLALARFGRHRGAAAWLYLVLLAGAAGTVGYNGHLGGQAVFRHGVGTDPVQRSTAPHAPAPAAP